MSTLYSFLVLFAIIGSCWGASTKKIKRLSTYPLIVKIIAGCLVVLYANALLGELLGFLLSQPIVFSHIITCIRITIALCTIQIAIARLLLLIFSVERSVLRLWLFAITLYFSHFLFLGFIIEDYKVLYHLVDLLALAFLFYYCYKARVIHDYGRNAAFRLGFDGAMWNAVFSILVPASAAILRDFYYKTQLPFISFLSEFIFESCIFAFLVLIVVYTIKKNIKNAEIAELLKMCVINVALFGWLYYLAWFWGFSPFDPIYLLSLLLIFLLVVVIVEDMRDANNNENNKKQK